MSEVNEVDHQADNQDENQDENQNDQLVQLENSLKQLLENLLRYVEKFITTKEDLAEIESKLNDYDSLTQLVDIIKNILGHLISKIDYKLTPSNPGNEQFTAEEYYSLEKIVQKHEAEIRTHIRLEQQLKLYAETLQQKIDDQEKSRTDLLDSTKQMINNLKRENQQQNENLLKFKEENQKFKNQINELSDKSKQCEMLQLNNTYLQDRIKTLEKLLSESKVSQSLQSIQQDNSSYKKLNVDIDIKKKIKAETPPVGYSEHSPIKYEKRIPTPNIMQQQPKISNDYLKVKIEIGDSKNNKKQDFKNTYQRFYNQVKQAKEQSMHSINKDIKKIYANSMQFVKPPNNFVREKEAFRSMMSGSQNSIINSHNNSFAYTASSSMGFNGHKRSKSHQSKQIRQSQSSVKNPTDYSKLSSQEFTDIKLSNALLKQEKNLSQGSITTSKK